MEIFDITGRKVALIEKEVNNTRPFRIFWNAGDVSLVSLYYNFVWEVKNISTS